MYLVWLLIVTSAFVYNVVVVPLRASFPYQDDENVFQWMAVDYLCDAIYLLDTALVRPRLRFIRDGFWVDEVRETRNNYVASLGFKLDLLSLVPLDFFYFYFGPHMPILRLPRMLRVRFKNSFEIKLKLMNKLIADPSILGTV